MGPLLDIELWPILKILGQLLFSASDNLGGRFYLTGNTTFSQIESLIFVMDFVLKKCQINKGILVSNSFGKMCQINMGTKCQINVGTQHNTIRKCQINMGRNLSR